MEWLPPGFAIPAAAPSDYDSTGRALLPAIYADWFVSVHNLRRHELALDAATELPLEILHPRYHATLLLDPEIPGSGATLRLRSNLPQHTDWSSRTLAIQAGIARLTPGKHTVTATDRRNGNEQHVTIIVKRL